jgi:hypothetical protein
MTTMHADHCGDELSRIWETNIIWKREHLLEGSIAPVPIETLEWPRKVPPDSRDYGSASSEVEVHRGEAGRPLGDGQPLAH